MDTLDLSRWQFGITTVYHFLFVPLTIGLAPLVAIMQTMWLVTKKDSWYRATKFFGKLFLINFALGVATGIVQEFQFGMNWDGYSRFVGDVFGAPLALEGLVAFFLESTFLGLWIFGWTKLPRWIHLGCIWLVALGVNASAYFIIAANSFMQHPVGAHYNAEKNRLELHSIWALLTNVTTLAAFPHTIAGCFLVGGTFVAGIASWWMVRSMRRAADAHKTYNPDSASRYVDDARQTYRPAARLGLVVMVTAAAVLFLTGDWQGKLMFEQQPMKMASAESLCHTEKAPAFSILTTGTHNNCDSVQHIIEIPKMTSFLATSTFDATLPGVEDLQKEYVHRYGPGDYRPNLFVTYWAFRFMMGWAVGSGVLALAVLWTTRKGRVPTNPWFGRAALILVPTPFLANSCGWVFTEMGRQPWIVAPNPKGDPQAHLLVQQAVSDHPPGTVITSLLVFGALYGLCFVLWCVLMRRYVLEGPLPSDSAPHGDSHTPASDSRDDTVGGDPSSGDNQARSSGLSHEESDEPQLSFAY